MFDTEVQNDLAMWEVQRSLADLERRITEHLATMPASAVPATLYEITNWEKALNRIKAVVEAKAAAVWDEAVPFGAAWKGPDGEAYVFDGTHSRKVTDIDGLRVALREVMMERAKETKPNIALDIALIDATFRQKVEILMTPLNELAEIDPRYREVRDDFATWSHGPRHLRRVKESS